MDSFAALKRRTTDLLQPIPQNLPSLPSKNKSPPALKGTWEKIDVPPYQRSSHTINVVSGVAYIFGGEVDPRKPVDNAMHIVTLPFSSAGADCVTIKAQPTKQYNPPAEPEPQEEGVTDTPENDGKETELDDVPLASPTVVEAGTFEGTEDAATSKGKGLAGPERPALGDVPEPRVGHATAAIGSRIFLFGGRGGPDMQPLDEGGRVWVFETRTHTWSFLDPVPPAAGLTLSPTPAPRSYHCAASTDRPRDFAPKTKRPETWRQWAAGDSAEVGIPQAPIVGSVAARAVDEDEDGYGTFFIHAGCLAGKPRTNDLWAFDVRSRVWTELPAAPGPARGGTAICVSKSRLFRYGGFDGTSELGGQLDFIHLEVDSFDDGVSKGEIGVYARSGWQSILQGSDAGEDEIQLISSQVWPGNRSVAGLETVTTGAGREYILLIMGEGAPSPDGHAGAGKMWDDIWAFQVPPLGMTGASVRDAMLQAMGRPTGEGKWTKVDMGPYDDDNNDGEPVPRGWMATAAMNDVEESGVVLWGGLSSENKRLSDGWILRLG